MNDEAIELAENMYPINIHQGRYGIEWFAVVGHKNFTCSDIYNDHDIAFYDPDPSVARIGIGETPQKALDDLTRRWVADGRPSLYSWSWEHDE